MKKIYKISILFHLIWYPLIITILTSSAAKNPKFSSIPVIFCIVLGIIGLFVTGIIPLYRLTRKERSRYYAVKAIMDKIC